ncbi:MAG: helix-turn-helix domain-containing protein [Elusimicrobiaceae bacterium]|nr:helix-turn-helix domain-containing protein [Elusimicrobiaceae bacterium]
MTEKPDLPVAGSGTEHASGPAAEPHDSAARQPGQLQPAQPAQAPRSATAGERLKALREEKGISAEMLHRRTKIPLKTISALETDDTAYYASDPYARSFLEQYCEYIGVEPDELRSSFEKAAEPLRRADQRPRTILNPGSPLDEESYVSAAQAYFFKTAAASAAVLALLTLWLWKNADYFGWPASGESAIASPSLYEAAFISRLEGLVTERTWLRVTADRRTVFEGYAPAGVKLGWTASKEFKVESDRPDNLQLSLDNRKLEQFTKTQTLIPVVFSGAETK